MSAECRNCQGDIDRGVVSLCEFHEASGVIGNEILRIMHAYHEQDRRGNIDTPGGLEHMGDVWTLFGMWEHRLKVEGAQ